MLIYRTYTKYLIYLRQKPIDNRKDFKGITATSINPLPFRTPLAKQFEYIKSLLYLFLLLLLSL